ncbi:MAG: hypothetical protein MPJ83_06705 [Gammaproteobacteria bacterium]|nr:hypothetical protein [Gammaproteobacteria bacterium]MDA8022655.1 hypothetical protein [Gammaproteobacteria bacterium]
MKNYATITKDAFFQKSFDGIEEMTAKEYLKALEHSERIDHSKTEFVPPVLGEPGFGHFLVKWRYPWHAVTREK